MGLREVKAEEKELADEIAKVIARHRAEWRSDHGAGAEYMHIAVGAVTRELARQLINGFRDHHGHVPTMEHMAESCSNYPPVLMTATGELLGVKVMNVDLSQLREVFDAVLQGRL